MSKTSKVLAEVTKEVKEFRKILNDPNAVHISLLREEIARPSVSQIVHIYGNELRDYFYEEIISSILDKTNEKFT